MTFDNLSGGDTFVRIGRFGVGYSYQNISNDTIPSTLHKSVTDALSRTDIAVHVESITVELNKADASSLDFRICVTMSIAAVRSNFKINRIVQQA